MRVCPRGAIDIHNILIRNKYKNNCKKRLNILILLIYITCAIIKAKVKIKQANKAIYKVACTEEAKSYKSQEVCNERKTNFCREKA